MAFQDLLVTEIFHSLQGEGTLTGVRFAFIRLTGCNLRCSYCDTAYAFKGGTRMSLKAVLDRIEPWSVKHVLLTGGEPLMQRQSLSLVHLLRDEGYAVSIETHGEAPIREFAPLARIVMDIKTPSSGMSRGGFRENLRWLKPEDEIKFVIASEEDYVWAREIVREGRLPTREVLFSPALASPGAPGQFSGVGARWLAERILEDRLDVRLQMQLHKIIWGADARGV